MHQGQQDALAAHLDFVHLHAAYEFRAVGSLQRLFPLRHAPGAADLREQPAALGGCRIKAGRRAGAELLGRHAGHLRQPEIARQHLPAVVRNADAHGSRLEQGAIPLLRFAERRFGLLAGYDFGLQRGHGLVQVRRPFLDAPFQFIVVPAQRRLGDFAPGDVHGGAEGARRFAAFVGDHLAGGGQPVDRAVRPEHAVFDLEITALRHGAGQLGLNDGTIRRQHALLPVGIGAFKAAAGQAVESFQFLAPDDFASL